MTEKTRKYAETHIRAQQNAIRRTRETAQLARMLWPKDAEDDLVAWADAHDYTITR